MATEWTHRSDDDITIAHLSDLHFGSKKADDIWTLLDQFLGTTLRPHLLLVTGDLVDHPKPKLYQNAHSRLQALKIPYFVCAGNHDRHTKGNRLFRWIPRLNRSSQFDKVFQGKVVIHDVAQTVPLANRENSWKLGLLGADSSINSDLFARGYVRQEEFDAIVRATAQADWDIAIFLVHHHVLSVRRLEERRQQSWKDLVNVTSLVNSGTLLEVLSRARIDLVLHGHEHEHNWAVYGSFVPGRSHPKIIGAGSATGNDCIAGCSSDRASFNVFTLCADRTVNLRRVGFRDGTWNVEDELQIFNTAELRRAWTRRRHSDLRGEVRNEVTKYVEFTRERDIVVRWLFTNWVPAVEYEQPISSASGAVDEDSLEVRLVKPDGTECKPPARFEKGDKGDATWIIRWTVPEPFRNTPLTMEICYRWRAAGILTKEEMERVRTGRAPGRIRGGGKEFTVVWTPVPAASGELIVSIPPEYAPTDLDVFVQDHEEIAVEHEAKELRGFLRTLKLGQYSLRVASPREWRDYILAWEPVSEQKFYSNQGYQTFRTVAVANAETFVKTFGQQFADTGLNGHMSLGLYAKATDSSGDFELIAESARFDASNDSACRLAIDERFRADDQSVLGRAWSGEVTIVRERPAGADAAELGFRRDETSVILVPIRFDLAWLNPPPLAVMRIGIFEDAEKGGLLSEGQSANLWKVLATGAACLNAEILRRM